MPGFQLVQPLIKGTFPAFIVINTNFRNQGAAIFQMAAGVKRHWNFHPGFRTDGKFAPHDKPPFVGGMVFCSLPVNALLPIRMSKEDATNPDGAVHFFNRLESLHIILNNGWGNEKWAINEV